MKKRGLKRYYRNLSKLDLADRIRRAILCLFLSLLSDEGRLLFSLSFSVHFLLCLFPQPCEYRNAPLAVGGFLNHQEEILLGD